MKRFKLHIAPIIVEAENEEAAEAWIQENIDKLEVSLFEEISI